MLFSFRSLKEFNEKCSALLWLPPYANAILHLLAKIENAQQ